MGVGAHVAALQAGGSKGLPLGVPESLAFTPQCTEVPRS